MPFYAGQQGKLFINPVGANPTPAAKVVSWSFNSTQNTLDTTTLSDTDRTAIYGIRSLSGACRLFYYNYSDGGAVKNSCGELLGKILKVSNGNVPGDGVNAPSDSVIIRLYLEDGSSTGIYIDIPALITSASMSMGVGEVLAADITFESNGAPLSGTNINQARTGAFVS